MKQLLFIFLLLIFMPLSAEDFVVEDVSENEINVRHYAADGDLLIIWLVDHDAHRKMFEKMLQDITALPVIREEASFQDEELDLDGKRFKVPRSLQRYLKQTGDWKKLVGKLWQAPVDLGGDSRAEFIYMERGGSVPEHTHKGSEWTLVINGEFEDGKHHYGTGDLILLDSEDTHTPISNDPDGCLVFSIVDKPLHFTSGLARLLNPFSHLFFKS